MDSKPEEAFGLSEDEAQEIEEALRRPLAAYSADELLDELMLRFHGFLFWGYERPGDDITRFVRREHGDRLCALGMADILHEQMRAAWR